MAGLFDDLNLGDKPASTPESEPAAGLFDDLVSTASGQGVESDLPEGAVAYDDPSRGSHTEVEQSFVERNVTDPLQSGVAKARQGIATTRRELGGYEGRDEAFGARMADLERESESHGQSVADMDKLAELSDAGWAEAAKGLGTNPSLISQIVFQSIGQYAPGLAVVAGASAINPIGTAVAAGASSFGLEYTSSIAEAIKERGGDPTDPKTWVDGVQDEELMGAAREKGVKRGIAIGTFDALSAGLAGKLLLGAKRNALSVGSRVAGETGLQVGAGMAGEATALAVTGEEIKPFDVLAEGVAGAATGITEVPGNVATARRKAAEREEGSVEDQDVNPELTSEALGEPTVEGTQMPEPDSRINIFNPTPGSKAYLSAIGENVEMVGFMPREDGTPNPNIAQVRLSDGSTRDVGVDLLTPEKPSDPIRDAALDTMHSLNSEIDSIVDTTGVGPEGGVIDAMTSMQQPSELMDGVVAESRRQMEEANAQVSEQPVEVEPLSIDEISDNFRRQAGPDLGVEPETGQTGGLFDDLPSFLKPTPEEVSRRKLSEGVDARSSQTQSQADLNNPKPVIDKVAAARRGKLDRVVREDANYLFLRRDGSEITRAPAAEVDRSFPEIATSEDSQTAFFAHQATREGDINSLREEAEAARDQEVFDAPEGVLRNYATKRADETSIVELDEDTGDYVFFDNADNEISRASAASVDAQFPHIENNRKSLISYWEEEGAGMETRELRKVAGDKVGDVVDDVPNLSIVDEVETDYDITEDKNGRLFVAGDIEEIRSKLPKGILGTRVKKDGVDGVRFANNVAPRVIAALSGNQAGHGRAGNILKVKPKDGRGRYVGAPKKYDTPRKLKKLREQLNKLAVEGESGRMWYENSSKAVLDFVGGNVQEARKFVALLSIYSPQAHVNTNTTFAIRAWQQHKAGQPISTKTRVQDAKAQAALDNVDQFWSGEKTGNFFNNLLVEIDPKTKGKQGATIDMWMMRAAEYDTDVPNASQYSFMEDEVNRVAVDLGWEPQQVQAAIWVAMKARMENPGVKKDTEARSFEKKWIDYQDRKARKGRIVKNQEKYFANWIKTALAFEPSEGDFKLAKFDFADGLERHIGLVSWEARPSTRLPVLPGIHSAPYAHQIDFQQAVQEALYENGVDILAQRLGLMTSGDILAPGVWERGVSAGSQRRVVMAPRGGKDARGKGIDDSSKKLLETYTAVLGYVLQQDGVGYHRPFVASSQKKANGVQVDIGRTLTGEEMVDLESKMRSELSTGGLSPDDTGLVSYANGVRLINFEGLEDNRKFHQVARRALRETSLGDVKYDLFASDGDLVSNDWEVDRNGESYIKRIVEGGGPDLLEWVRSDLEPRIDEVRKEYAAKYGWGESTDSTPEAESGDAGSGEGVSVPSYGTGIEGSVSVEGIHYSTSIRTEVDSTNYGKGRRGAEASRVKDGGLAARSYFYVDEGKGVRPESGVGTNKHKVKLNNLYDWNKDPNGYWDMAKEAHPGDINAKTNFVEKKVVEDGYDGVYAPAAQGRQGVAVVLGEHKIPVLHEPRKPLYTPGGKTLREKTTGRKRYDKSGRDKKAKDLNQLFKTHYGKDLGIEAVSDDSVRLPGFMSSVRAIERALGRNIIFVKTKVAPPFDGVVDPSNPDTIFVHVDSQQPTMAVIGHEYLHTLASKDSAEFDRIASALAQANGVNQNTITAYANEVNEVRKKNKMGDIGYLLAREELLADITGEVWNDSNFWKTLSRQNPSVFRSVANAFLKMIDKVLDALPTRKSMRGAKYIRDMKASRKIIAEHLQRAVAKGKPEIKDGRDFRDFFTNVVTGVGGVSDTGVTYTPVIQGRTDLNEFATEYAKHRGNFDEHIAYSIPGYKEVQMAVGNAIVKTYGPRKSMLDIGASEGSIGKSITALGGPRTVSLDPNPAMEESFNTHSQVPGATYDMSAFTYADQAGKKQWMEGDRPVLGYRPGRRRFDVVHEAMVFQFINDDRQKQIPRVKEFLKVNGVAIFEEKVHNPNWAANEKKKDEDHKAKYFKPQQMTAKGKEVLEGMNKNMVPQSELESVLGENFAHVVQFWDSGNFKGYAASDNSAALARLVSNMGSLDSEFSTVETPRGVSGEPLLTPAYHGTPYKVDKFSTSKVGRGDGTQAFGWGLYFASKKEIAEFYKDTLSPKLDGVVFDGARVTNDRELFDVLKDRMGVSSDAEVRDKQAQFESNNPEFMVAYEAVRQALYNPMGVKTPYQKLEARQPPEVMKYVRESKNSGNLYQVDLKLDDTNTLDWHRSMRSQPAKVQTAFEGLFPDSYEVYDRDGKFKGDYPSLQQAKRRQPPGGKVEKDTIKEVHAGQLYQSLSKRLQDATGDGAPLIVDMGLDPHSDTVWKMPGDQLASMYLYSKGVKGIRFDAGTMQGGGAKDLGTNYVVFHDNDVTIEQVNDRPMELLFSVTDPEGFEAPVKMTWWDQTVGYFQNKYKALIKIQEAIGSENITEAQDARLHQINYPGRVKARIEEFEGVYFDTITGMMKASKYSQEQVGKYLHARHAAEANRVLKKRNLDKPDNEALSGMSDAEAEKILSQYKGDDDMVKIGRVVDALNRDKVDTLEREGVLSPGEAAAWRHDYAHYVPLHREDIDHEGMPGAGSGSGFQARGKVSKMRTGSRREVDHEHLLAWTLAGAEAAIVRIEKNTVAKSMYDLAKANPNEDLWEVDVVPQQPYRDAQGQIQYKDNPNANGVIHLKINGEPRYVTLNMNNEVAASLYKAWTNKDVGSEGLFGQKVLPKMLAVMRYFSMINTSLNPEFVISNFLRDYQTAGYNLSDTELRKQTLKTMKRVFPAMKGIWTALRGDEKGEWAAWYRRMEKTGGTTGWLAAYENIEDRANQIEKQISRHKKFGSLAAGGKAVIDFISDYNTVVENAVRLASFRTAVELGMSERQAAKIAKELTVNFNEKGSAGSLLNALYLFYNASIQGTTRMIRAMRTRRAQALIGATVGLAMVNHLFQSLDDDDEEYRFLPKSERDRNFVIKKFWGDEKGFIKVPLPWGYNVFHILGQELGDVALWAMDEKPDWKLSDTAGRLAKGTLESFNPVNDGSLLLSATPTLADPVVKVLTNTEWHGGSLMPDWNEAQQDHLKYFRSVREPSKWITEQLAELTLSEDGTSLVSISPEVLDMSFDTLTGATGRFVLDLTTSTYKVATGKGGDVETKRTPLLRKVFKEVGDSEIQRTFYETYHEFKPSYQAFRDNRTDKEWMRNAGLKYRKAWDRYKKLESEKRRLSRRLSAAYKAEDGQGKDDKIKAIKANQIKMMRKWLDDHREIMYE